MGPFEKVAVGKIVNLTDEPIWAYSYFGGIVYLAPESTESGDYYVVPDSDEPVQPNEAVITGRGSGRHGHKVVTLHLRRNRKIRVYPLGS